MKRVRSMVAGQRLSAALELANLEAQLREGVVLPEDIAALTTGRASRTRAASLDAFRERASRFFEAHICPAALGAMLASAVLRYLWCRKRGWL